MNREHILAQLLLPSWPFPTGAGRLLDTFFSELKFSEQATIAKPTDGFPISVSPNDLIGRHIYLTGEFDRSIVEILCRLAKPGDLLLDICANIGYISACFLSNIPNSRVIAVEPQPAVATLLRQNLSQFGPLRHQVVAAAVSDKAGAGWIQPYAENPGMGHLVQNETSDSIPVDLWTADQLFSFAKIDKLDLVKIDVEGCEEEVFGTCIEHFRKLRARAIIFECSSYYNSSRVS